MREGIWFPLEWTVSKILYMCLWSTRFSWMLSRCRVDCPAFPGGSVEALTRCVWLCSAVLRALDRAACIGSTLSAHLSKRTPLLASRRGCRGEVKAASHSEEEPAALFHTVPHRVLRLSVLISLRCCLPPNPLSTSQKHLSVTCTPKTSRSLQVFLNFVI